MTHHEPVRALDDLGAELRRVAIAEDDRRGLGVRGRLRALVPGPQVGGRTVALAASAVVALSGVAWAVPTTRTAIDDITSSFVDWVAGDDNAPGRALAPGDDVPEWLNAEEGRVIAESEGVQLVVQRVENERQGTMLSFPLGPDAHGDEMAIDGSIDGWRERFAQDPLAVLGTMAFDEGHYLDDAGRVPLAGVTASAVERVELRYASGPPLVADGLDGGFVLLADAWRGPHEVVAYAPDHTQLGRVDVSHIDLRYLCARDAACARRLDDGAATSR
jgi:hypothetical protein